MWPEIKRKFFHLFGLIYVLGLIYIPRDPYILILLTVLTSESLIELFRIKNEKVNQWFSQYFGEIFRDTEKTKISGVFWMLMGVTLTVILAPPVPIAAAALLYLILGDGLASLVGMRFGGPHWPGSRRRLSGSLACFLVCLFVGFILLRPLYGWPTVVAGAVAATFFERGLFSWNDNMTIPVGSALALLLSLKFLT